MFVVKEMERRMEEEEESIKATIRERLGEKFDLEFKLKVRVRESTVSCFSRYNGVYGFSPWSFFYNISRNSYTSSWIKKIPLVTWHCQKLNFRIFSRRLMLNKKFFKFINVWKTDNNHNFYSTRKNLLYFFMNFMIFFSQLNYYEGGPRGTGSRGRHSQRTPWGSR